jgi:hypothetical protein
MLQCAGFISADLLYMFRASGAHHQEYLKTGTAATGTCVMVAGRSSHHHIRDEIVSSLIWRCDDLPATITHVPVAAVPVFKYS